MQALSTPAQRSMSAPREIPGSGAGTLHAGPAQGALTGWPQSAGADAQAVMQRLLQATRVSAPRQPQFRYSCSIGLAPVAGCASIDELLGRADRALYAAKAGGRDCCVVLDAEPAGGG